MNPKRFVFSDSKHNHVEVRLKVSGLNFDVPYAGTKIQETENDVICFLESFNLSSILVLFLFSALSGSSLFKKKCAVCFFFQQKVYSF